MLLHIFIKNYGIIDRLETEFQTGLNVLTGETGAGKSIIIDALQLALGGRAHTDQIRAGAKKAIIQAAFDVSGINYFGSLLEAQGIERPEDGVLVLSRDISRTGKNICRINGQVTPLALFRNIGKNLVDMHLQHDQSSLLDQNKHRLLLDRFGGAKLLDKLDQVNTIFLSWKNARDNFQIFDKHAAEREKRIEILNYQIEEIAQAGLMPGEDEELTSEKNMLVNSENIALLAARAYAMIYEGDNDCVPVVELMAGAVNALKSLDKLDKRVGKVLTVLESALYQVEDAARELAGYRNGIESNPQRLEAVEERLEQIGKLKKKYGATLSEILKYLEHARDELDSLEDHSRLKEVAGRELAELEEAYVRTAALLSNTRQEAAEALEKAVTSELLSLEMGGVKFKVFFSGIEEPSRNGAERVEFLIAPNPGEPLRPLSKIASGGEITRIMLALKVLLADSDDLPVLVFDEADTGVGGRALQAVAEKMAHLGKRRQVICVTHSPQVASYAGAHYRVVKEIKGERTLTRVELLDAQGRLQELARMLGGKKVTEITLEHAGQMLRAASES
jgi:DNA repair protein RecN (Recombination protein N)